MIKLSKDLLRNICFLILLINCTTGYSQVIQTESTEDTILEEEETKPLNRTEVNSKTTGRQTGTTDQSLKNIAKEDSIRAVRIEEAELDGKKAAIRKRIFGNTLFSNTTFDPTATANISAPNNYVLGPSDELIINISGYMQLTETATIDTDGYITLAKTKAGLVKVAGLTLEEAETKLKNSISKIYPSIGGRNSKSTFKLSLGDAKTIKIYFTGEVIAPGTYTVNSLTTVLNALYLAAGPNEIGTYRKIKVIRGNKEVAVLDLYEILINGYSTSDILLKDQDVIQVGPYISRVAISGNLKRNGLFEMAPKETVSDLVNFAGGFNEDAYTKKIKLYRNTSSERKIIDISEKEYSSFIIQNGDSLAVEELLMRFENLVSIQGQVYRPGEYSLTNNPTLMDLINSADGFKGEAFLGRVSITRTNDDLSQENISVNIENIKRGLASDVPLKREDMVTVYNLFDLTEQATISIQGEVNGIEEEGDILDMPYLKNMTIEDLIVKAGGLKDGASLSRVEVIRRKRNVDIKDSGAEISEIFILDISPELKVVNKDSEFILQPFDEVIVRQSPNYTKQKFVTIEGEVTYPGPFGILKKNEKVSDLIERAGGLTPLAYIKGATLLRTIKLDAEEIEQRNQTLMELNTGGANVSLIEEDKQESIGINLEKILKRPNTVEDITLEEGDVIKIPKQLETVRIQGEVLYPTTAKYLPSSKFLDYISNSGGFTKNSLTSKAYIIYPNGSLDRTKRFLFANIYPKVQPGSEIIVPKKEKNAAQTLSQFSTILTVLLSAMGSIVTIIGLLRLTGN